MATSAPSDGHLVFYELRARTETGLDILRLRLDRSREVTPLVQTKAWEKHGVVSPDQRWIAYECCTEAQPEIHVSRYPITDGVRWPISSGGGVLPTWSSGSDRLFYVTRDGSLMEVVVDPRASSWTADSPRAVLPVGSLQVQEDWPFDISPDGRRVLTLRAATETSSIIYIRNWVEKFAGASQPATGQRPR